jgi:hypothetical protein
VFSPHSKLPCQPLYRRRVSKSIPQLRLPPSLSGPLVAPTPFLSPTLDFSRQRGHTPPPIRCCSSWTPKRTDLRRTSTVAPKFHQTSPLDVPRSTGQGIPSVTWMGKSCMVTRNPRGQQKYNGENLWPSSSEVEARMGCIAAIAHPSGCVQAWGPTVTETHTHAHSRINHLSLPVSVLVRIEATSWPDYLIRTTLIPTRKWSDERSFSHLIMFSVPYTPRGTQKLASSSSTAATGILCPSREPSPSS